MRKHDIVGLSIALVDDQRVVWAQGFGHADKEANVPATADTLYRVASISKLFTATAAMQLAERGQLDIDRPLQDYIPGFSIQTRYAQSAPITPRTLMTHHAGLPRDVLKGMVTRQPQPFGSVVEDLRTSTMAYAPGTLFSYSNTGVTLLGQAIENVSGVAFAEHMQRTVLHPLGMSHSSFRTGVSDGPLMSKGYHKGQLAEQFALRDVPAGGLNSSVTELSRFVSMVFADGKAGGHQILQPHTLRTMLQPQNLAVPLDFDLLMGLGWMLGSLGKTPIEGAGLLAQHGGALQAFRGQLKILPAHKLGVVILANSSSAGEAIDEIANDALSLALEAKTGIRPTEPPRQQHTEARLPESALEEYPGRYTTMAGLARIRADGTRLKADAMQRNFDLVPRGSGQLQLRYSLLGLLRIPLGPLDDIGLSLRSVAGRQVLVAHANGQEVLVGQKMALAAAPITPAWRQRLGSYEIEDGGNDHLFTRNIRLIEDQGQLVVDVAIEDEPARTRIPLKPLSDTEALLLGLLDDGGETLGVGQFNGEERLLFSGYQLKRVGK
jgi:CubicO group peptidase (beta-lactamase class C family)